MSSLKVHLLQGGTTTVMLYPFIDINAVVVGASIVLIALDHWVESLHATGSPEIKTIFNLHDLVQGHLDEALGMNLFHSVECYLLLAILGYFFFPVLLYVLSGFLFHHFFDQIYLTQKGYPFVRALSLIEYFFRKKKYLTIKQVVEKYGMPE